MNLKILSFITICSSIILNAQQTEYSNIELTGSLPLDSKILFNKYEELPLVQMNDDVISPKSPLLAGFLSAALPGAGQFYNGDYWKTAIFVAIEGALISTAIIYNNKGDDQNAKFEAYADQYWSVVRYAKWMNSFRNTSIPIDETTPGLEPWERIDWTDLNEAEDTQSDFSHNLYPHGEQQYYEMIGKYHQFASGWDDFPENQGTVDPISAHFIYYSGERGKANDYYDIGDKAVLGLIINHAASIVEAILAANSFNKDLSLKFRVDDVQLTTQHELIPTLMVKYSF